MKYRKILIEYIEVYIFMSEKCLYLISSPEDITFWITSDFSITFDLKLRLSCRNAALTQLFNIVALKL